MFRFYHVTPPTPSSADQSQNLTISKRHLKFDLYVLAYGLMAVFVAIRLAIALLAYFVVATPAAKVGDVLMFNEANTTTLKEFKVVAHVAGTRSAGLGRPCNIDTLVLLDQGTVLTVLALRADNVLVSWSGDKTANLNSCTRDEPIFINNADYEQLLSSHLAKPSR